MEKSKEKEKTVLVALFFGRRWPIFNRSFSTEISFLHTYCIVISYHLITVSTTYLQMYLFARESGSHFLV